MTIRRYTTHHQYIECDEEIFPLPFDPGYDPEFVYVSANGLEAVLAFVVPDDSPLDPLEEFEEGEFYQFDHSCIHDTDRPDLEGFKRLVRGNPGRIVTVDRCGASYRVGGLVTPSDCRNKPSRDGYLCRAERMLEDAGGYYIAPEDVTDALRYAAGVLQRYSAWCEGDVYGVAMWRYTRASIADEWEDPDRDNECWGYYGYRDAIEELKREFNTCFDLNTIERGRK